MSDEELLKVISSREFWRKYRNDEQNNNLDLYINYYKLIEEAGKLVKDLSLKQLKDLKFTLIGKIKELQRETRKIDKEIKERKKHETIN